MLMTNAIATTEDMVARDAKPAGSHTYPNGRWQSVVFQPSDFATPDDHFADARRILDAAVAILAQGEDLLRAISAECYMRRVPAAFNACIADKARKDAVIASRSEAETTFKVNSTPTFFINDRVLKGVSEYEAFKATIDGALARAQ